MLTREDFETLINSIKEKLDETTQGLLAEDFLQIVSNYYLALDSIAEMTESVDKLKDDNEELLKVNGKLFQKIGFEKEEEEKAEEVAEEVAEGEEVAIEEIIDEKGDLI